jgi:hypothetical protein
MIVFRRKSDAYYLTARALFFIWGLVGLLVLSFSAIRLWQYHEHMMAVRAFNAHEQALSDEFEECTGKIKGFLSGKQLSSVTRSDLEAGLNRGSPFSVTFDAQGNQSLAEAEGFDLTAYWAGPSGEQEDIRFSFRNNRLVSWFAVGPPLHLIFMSLPLTSTDMWTLGMGDRIATSSLGAIVWGIGFLGLLFMRRWRPVLVQPLMLMSLSGVIAALLTPNYSLYLAGNSPLINYVHVCWPSAMLGASMTAALWTLAAARQSPVRLCETCEYELTGNTSGICPECGSAIEMEPDQLVSA